MARTSQPVNLTAEDQAQLVQWESAHGTPQQVALRCGLVLAAAAGQQDLQIASAYRISRHTAALWRGRVRTAGIEAEDRHFISKHESGAGDGVPQLPNTFG